MGGLGSFLEHTCLNTGERLAEILFVALWSPSLSPRNSLPLGSATSFLDSSLVLWPPLPFPARLSRRALGERHRYGMTAGYHHTRDGGSESLAQDPRETTDL